MYTVQEMLYTIQEMMDTIQDMWYDKHWMLLRKMSFYISHQQSFTKAY